MVVAKDNTVTMTDGYLQVTRPGHLMYRSRMKAMPHPQTPFDKNAVSEVDIFFKKNRTAPSEVLPLSRNDSPFGCRKGSGYPMKLAIS